MRTEPDPTAPRSEALASPATLQTEVEAEFPIPNRLNAALVAVVFCGAIVLLWIASRLDSWIAVFAIGLVFSYLMLTNYALLHEAAHCNLNSRLHFNYWLGLALGLLFPIPFSMIHSTHQGHHRNNRTDAEMFDLYYATDNRFRKYVQWYGILCGFFWPLVPLGTLLFCLLPRWFRRLIFERPRSTGYLFAGVNDIQVWQVRAEGLLILGFFTALFWLLDLRWLPTLLLYACFSFNWSTRQYVGHAFTRRDVVEGAWNLRHNRLMTWVLLHGEYDLAHHRRPDVPWLYLPRLVSAGETRPDYLGSYWRQWLGPRPVTESAPNPLHLGDRTGRVLDGKE
ncbi:MAG: fatty acid desaturase [Verrucomicrobia bacterium]|nr:fatty acid desaturase [Verrucomicrobiota bacterium]